MLRTLARLTLVSILALTGCGGTPTPGELVTKQLALMQEYGAVLTKVTDKATAEQHKSTVTSLVDQMNELRKDIKYATDEERSAGAARARELEPEFQAARAKMQAELKRLETNKEVQHVLGSTLERL